MMVELVRNDSAPWLPVGCELRERVEEVLRDIAERYKDPEQVRQRMREVPPEQLDGMSYARWRDISLASGFPGICLLMGQMDHLFPHEGWDLIGHRYLELLQKTIEEEGIQHLSLYNGLAGILVGIHSLSRKRTRYLKMMDTLADLYEQKMGSIIDRIRCNWNEGNMMMGDYDVIQGLSGMGRVALLFSERSGMRKIWEDTVTLFHLYCGEKEIAGQLVPSWHISSMNQFRAEEKVKYPNGNFNLGLSHGISGPLAFLSVSYLHGIQAESVASDLHTLAEFVCKWSIRKEKGTFFAGRISFEEWEQERLLPSAELEYRDSWCYGVPGIARSLWLAGKALQNEKWLEISLRAYMEISNRAHMKGGLTSGTLCHGVGGLLHLIQRMYSDTGHETLRSMRDRFAKDVLDLYEPGSLFGYYDESYQMGDYTKVDEAGFLTGASGVALVLASLLSDQSPDWDLVLMIQ